MLKSISLLIKVESFKSFWVSLACFFTPLTNIKLWLPFGLRCGLKQMELKKCSLKHSE